MTINLKIKEKTVELTYKEAEKLFNDLKPIFDRERTPVIPAYPNYPSWPLDLPWWRRAPSCDPHPPVWPSWIPDTICKAN